MALINSLCAMLRTAPFHRENHARLILGVVIQFYQRCYDRFQLLVSTNKPESDDVPPEPILAAQWAQTPVFTPGLAELLNSVSVRMCLGIVSDAYFLAGRGRHEATATIASRNSTGTRCSGSG